MARPKNYAGQMPIFGDFAKSQVEWRPTPVNQLPSWAGAKRIGIDLETYDPKLPELGPGVRRGGYVVGISFKIEDGGGFYLPIRHPEDNLPAEHVWAYLQDQFKTFDGDVVGANLSYDLDYLWQNRVLMPKVRRYRDIQVAEPLIDELQFSYSLDNIAKRHGLPGKDESTLRQGAEAFGVDPKRGLWQLPGRFVGAYAIQDVALPLAILRRQERLIEENDLGKIYDLECRLTPVLLKMRRRGVLINQKHLQYVEDWSIQEQQVELDKIYHASGVRLSLDDVNKPQALAMALRKIDGIEIPKTVKGADSITKDWLFGLKHPIATAINRARKMDKLRGTFVNSVRTHMVNGRIHGTFNQMRRSSDTETNDDEGARYGRLSSVDPNLQQQPARDPETGKLWRKVYVPDPGMLWAAKDYSQQEPRFTYHYAFACQLPGAEKIVRRFCEDMTADSHTEFTKLVWPEDCVDMKSKVFKERRGYAKTIFLGICYGMGGAKLCRKIGKPTMWKHVARLGKNIEVAGPEGQAILDTVDQRMPFLRQLAKMCEARAKSTGCIRTYLGRLCHFPLKPDGTVDWAHKALNRLIQGSAADQTKLAVVLMDEAGYVTERTDIPGVQLQVHDEIDSSVDTPQTAEKMADIMRYCCELSLPSKVDVEIGMSWGDSMDAGSTPVPITIPDTPMVGGLDIGAQR